MSVKTAPGVPHGTYNLDLSSLNHPEDELIAMRCEYLGTSAGVPAQSRDAALVGTMYH